MVYAWLTPLLMLAAFAAGPLLGLGAAQAGFTLVVSVVFAQVAPANWELAEDRVLAVIIGGLVGALIGAAVWPRGGGGEVRRVAADCMRAGADEIVASAAYLTGTGPPPSTEPLTRLSTLFEYTYAQYRSEPARPGPEPDWLVVLAVADRIAEYSRTLCVRYPVTDPLPWPDFGVLLRADAEGVADAYRAAAAAVAAGDSTVGGRDGAARAGRRPAPGRALRRGACRGAAGVRRLGLDPQARGRAGPGGTRSDADGPSWSGARPDGLTQLSTGRSERPTSSNAGRAHRESPVPERNLRRRPEQRPRRTHG